jgi:hypothetical protein
MAAAQTSASPWRQAGAMVLVLSIAAAPVPAQTIDHRLETRAAAATAVTRPPSALGGRHGWLGDAIQAAARTHADGLTQNAAATTSTRAGSCAKRVVLFTLLGTGVSLGAAGILLASTGGSDDTGGILTRWALFGAAAGGAVGALICLAP